VSGSEDTAVLSGIVYTLNETVVPGSLPVGQDFTIRATVDGGPVREVCVKFAARVLD
jgi:hypothetical protein